MEYETVQAYKASDGALFESPAEVEVYEAYLDYRRYYEKCFSDPDFEPEILAVDLIEPDKLRFFFLTQPEWVLRFLGSETTATTENTNQERGMSF